MVEEGTGSDVGQIPLLIEKFRRAVKQAVKASVIAKLTPNLILCHLLPKQPLEVELMD